MQINILKPNARYFNNILKEKPYAKASIKGSQKFPQLHGSVYFYKAANGTLVMAEIHKLPEYDNEKNKNITGPYGFHIHEGNSCTGDNSDPFKNAGTHYNPKNSAHPMHAGDMPSLFSNNGYAYMVFYTNRFTPEEVTGKAAVIHENPDDYKTQPSGNSGNKIGCGIIKKYS